MLLGAFFLHKPARAEIAAIENVEPTESSAESPYASDDAGDKAVPGDAPKAENIDEKAQDDEFAAASSKHFSLATNAPALLVYLQDSQNLYGLPGTKNSPNILKRNYLTGDWGGLRTNLARNGVYFDIYSVSAFTRTRKGLGGKSTFLQNMQYSANFDTGRLGLWGGGLIHVTAQQKMGSKARYQDRSDASSPYYVNAILPMSDNNSFHFNEYYIYQYLTKNLSVVAGKIPTLYLPDQTIFASSAKQDFANFSFGGANPLYLNYYTTTSWVGMGFLKLNNNLTFIFGALDPSSEPNNFAKRVFKRTNVFGQLNINYSIGGMPGQAVPQINWYNKPTTDYKHLVRYGTEKRVKSALMLALNTSQYIYVIDTPEEMKHKLNTGKVVRGFGFITRAGWGPSRTNFISNHASIGLYAAGILKARPLDRFGFGFYHNGINKHYRRYENNIADRSVRIRSETGTEIFYNFALTPAISWINSFTYIWHPTYSEVSEASRRSNVYMSRIFIRW